MHKRLKGTQIYYGNTNANYAGKPLYQRDKRTVTAWKILPNTPGIEHTTTATG